MSYENFVQVQLDQPAAAADATLYIRDAVAPYNLPPEDGGVLVLTDSMGKPSAVEIIRYAARDGLALTGLERGAEGTTARGWPTGSYCYQSLTAGGFEAVMDELEVRIDDAEQAIVDIIDTVEAYKVGDYLTTARDPGANWLRRDGGRYNVADYPDLSLLMPPAPLELDCVEVTSPVYSYTDRMTDNYGGNYPVMADGGVIVYFGRGAGTTFGCYRSSDNGATWSYVSIVSGGSTTGAWKSAVSGNKIILADVYRNNKVYYSLNSGASWATLTYSGSILDKAFYDSLNDCFVLMSGTTRTSSLNKTFKSNTLDGAGSISITEQSSWSSTGGLAGASCHVHGYTFYSVQSDKTYYSTNFGSTRTALVFPSGGNNYLPAGVQHINGKFYLLDHDGKVYWTTNFASYTEVAGVTMASISKVSMTGNNPGIIGWIGSLDVLYSTDGDNWNNFTLAGEKFYSNGSCVPSHDFINDKTFWGYSSNNSVLKVSKAQVPEGEEFLVPNDGGGRNWIKAL